MGVDAYCNEYIIAFWLKQGKFIDSFDRMTAREIFDICECSDDVDYSSGCREKYGIYLPDFARNRHEFNTYEEYEKTRSEWKSEFLSQYYKCVELDVEKHSGVAQILGQTRPEHVRAFFIKEATERL